MTTVLEEYSNMSPVKKLAFLERVLSNLTIMVAELNNSLLEDFEMFDELKTRIRKNIERNEAALADLRKQLAQVEALEAAQGKLDLETKTKGTTK